MKSGKLCGSDCPLSSHRLFIGAVYFDFNSEIFAESLSTSTSRFAISRSTLSGISYAQKGAFLGCHSLFPQKFLPQSRGGVYWRSPRNSSVASPTTLSLAPVSAFVSHLSCHIPTRCNPASMSSRVRSRENSATTSGSRVTMSPRRMVAASHVGREARARWPRGSSSSVISIAPNHPMRAGRWAQYSEIPYQWTRARHGQRQHCQSRHLQSRRHRRRTRRR
mmetsp:Transcript_4061/g.11740  ORF Transcript_4061/g.11740 Transcript_4061/m.11740 type:complete len:221 (+) Transcript_4061:531-1193(+)